MFINPSEAKEIVRKANDFIGPQLILPETESPAVSGNPNGLFAPQPAVVAVASAAIHSKPAQDTLLMPLQSMNLHDSYDDQYEDEVQAMLASLVRASDHADFSVVLHLLQQHPSPFSEDPFSEDLLCSMQIDPRENALVFKLRAKEVSSKHHELTYNTVMRKFYELAKTYGCQAFNGWHYDANCGGSFPLCGIIINEKLLEAARHAQAEMPGQAQGPRM